MCVDDGVSKAPTARLSRGTQSNRFSCQSRGRGASPTHGEWKWTAQETNCWGKQVAQRETLLGTNNKS